MTQQKKERSFIERTKIPLNALRDGLSMSTLIERMAFERIADDDKRELIVVKEAFVLVDRRARSVGVFTRSSADHRSKIGQCSVMLCGNFDKSECTVAPGGMIIYDAKARLHRQMKEVSGLFAEARTQSLPAIFLEDAKSAKSYLFLLFELECDSRDVPLYYELDERQNDRFIGMREVGLVANGLQKYNRSPFEVDKQVVSALTAPRRRFPTFGSSKFSIMEKAVEAKLASVTVFKFSVVG